MLDSVLVARDRWLAPTGIMAPSCTRILIAAFGDAEWYNDKINFWNDVYGFSMKAMNSDMIRDGFVTVVPMAGMISDSIVVKDIQTGTVTSPKLDFIEDFELKISRDGKVYAFVGWFDTYFEGPNIDPVMFSTSPATTATHWMQTVFILAEPIPVLENESVKGVFRCRKSLANPRELVVTIEWRMDVRGIRGRQEFNVM